MLITFSTTTRKVELLCPVIQLSPSPDRQWGFEERAPIIIIIILYEAASRGTGGGWWREMTGWTDVMWRAAAKLIENPSFHIDIGNDRF